MFCRNCGNQISDGAKFCSVCGAPAQPVPQTRAAAPNNYYQQPAYSGGYAPAPVSSRAKVTTKWPTVCGVMGVLYVFFFIISMVLMIFYFKDMGIPGSVIPSIMRAQIITLILAIAVPVLFFVHTKKQAFLTAIPMVLMFIINLITLITLLTQNGGLYGSPSPANEIYSSVYTTLFGLSISLFLTNVIPLFFSFILLVFYVIQMIVRPQGAALPVLYLIFTIILVLYFLITFVLGLVEGLGGYILASNLVKVIASIFLAVAYIVAMYSSRKL